MKFLDFTLMLEIKGKKYIYLKVNMINKEICSGCSACENICPTNAITLKIDELTGFKLAEIDTTKCILFCNILF